MVKKGRYDVNIVRDRGVTSLSLRGPRSDPSCEVETSASSRKGVIQEFKPGGATFAEEDRIFRLSWPKVWFCG